MCLMNSCDSKIKSEELKFFYTPFFRQLLICSGVWTSHFLMGLCLGATTVLVPQIRNEANSTDAVSEEMASWLPAVLGYSGIPWLFILTSILANFGRKRTFITVCINSFAGLIVFYFSTTPLHILFSEILQGAVSASLLTVSYIIITEYTSSKYRGLFLTIKSATLYWGILVSNTIGTFFHWRYISLFGLLCSVYSLLSTMLWPESPFWLASKGRLDECSVAHRWLKGTDIDSEKELARLIQSYESVSEKVGISKKKSLKTRVLKQFNILLQRTFYKPVLLATLLLLLQTFSGGIVCNLYAIDIIKKISKSESAAYTGMLILDAVTVASMYLCSFLCKFLKRRTMLLVFGSICSIFLFFISVYLYFVKLCIVAEDNLITILLLTGFSISVSFGPTVLCATIAGEMLPLKSRSTCVCIIAILVIILSNVFVNISPYLFKLLGLHGAFCFLAISSSICLVLSYIYISETKDKTLQEIADYMTKNKEPVVEATQLMPLATSLNH